MPKDDLRDHVDMLYEAPLMIKLAKEVIDFLPKGKNRDDVIKSLLDVRKSLINLDVVLQDIEWGILESELNKKYQ